MREQEADSADWGSISMSAVADIRCSIWIAATAAAAAADATEEEEAITKTATQTTAQTL